MSTLTGADQNESSFLHSSFFCAFDEFYFLPSTNTVNFCIFLVLIARIVHFIYVSLSAIRSITFRKNRVHCYPIATHCHPVTALTPCLLFLSNTGAPCLPSLPARCGRMWYNEVVKRAFALLHLSSLIVWIICGDGDVWRAFFVSFF